jgi:nucleotide-binding universal stress UspA family protein
MQNFLERDLANRVEMLLPRDKITIRVAPGWGRLDAHLLELAEREHFDLIVIGTHRRHGLEWLRFGSVSRSILRHANIPVAVAPPPETQKRAKIPELDRVLVATDFSEWGNNAVPYACAILRRGGALKLFHVIEPSSAGASEKFAPHPRKENPKLGVELRSLVPSDCSDRIQIEQEISESSNAAEAIAQAAERFDADVICLGSHGRSGLAKTLLGSVAQGVMTQSKRPVFVVRASE